MPLIYKKEKKVEPIKSAKGLADKVTKGTGPAKFKFLAGGDSYPRFGASGDTKTTTPQMSIIKDNIKKVKPVKPSVEPEMDPDRNKASGPANSKEFTPPTDDEYESMNTRDRNRIRDLTKDIEPDWVKKGKKEEQEKKKNSK